jgi:hypothetical protein
MKKLFKLILTFFLFAWPIKALAQSINIGQPFPGMTTNQVSGWPEYVRWLYRTSLMVAVVLAVLMLVYGGYKYIISSGNPEALGEAKDIITGTVVALILLILAGILLQTIDPNIIQFG